MKRIRREFEKDTAYKMDTTNPNWTTYWFMYEEVGSEEYYRHYSQWLENNCALLTEDDCEYIFHFMPYWVKEQPDNLPAVFYGTGSKGGDEQILLKIKSLLRIKTP